VSGTAAATPCSDRTAIMGGLSDSDA